MLELKDHTVLWSSLIHMHSRKNFFKKTKIKDTHSLVHLKGLWNTKEISSNYVYKEFSYIENH